MHLVTLTDQEKDRIRQSERSVDNLKRLYAVLFSLALSLAFAETLSRIKPFFTHSGNVPHVTAFGLEGLFTLVLTVGIFYFQSDRYLDISYAVHPIKETKALQFGMSYLVNVLTMAPFFLIAASLDTDVLDNGGAEMFFYSYMLLFVFGLLLLLAKDAYSFILFRDAQSKQEAITLDSFWLIMNSMFLIVVWIVAFSYSSSFAPTKISKVLSFPYVFCILVIIRDIVDFSHGWHILSPFSPQKRPLPKAMVIPNLWGGCFR